MSATAERFRNHFYKDAEHPYRVFDREVGSRLAADSTLMDVGCGRTAPILQTYLGRARRLIGIDEVEFTISEPGLELRRGDLCRTGLPDCSVDVVMARSVMEHVTQPAAAYREMARILKPGGTFVFLTANLWDYASLAAHMIPNKLHPWLVSRTEGRAEEDVFPTAYKTNTRSTIHRFARQSGLQVARFDYLSQYPNYFLFNGPLFLLATGYEKVVSNVGPLKFLQGWILASLVKPALR